MVETIERTPSDLERGKLSHRQFAVSWSARSIVLGDELV
jgi:hypothetical protein